MVQTGRLKHAGLQVAFLLILFFLLLFNASSVRAAVDVSEGEKTYKVISDAVQGKGDSKLLLRMKEETAKLDWTKAQPLEFEGHLRLLKPQKSDETSSKVNVFLVRKHSGEIFILAAPPTAADPRYAGLEKMLQDKMAFKIETVKATVDGRELFFARFIERPHQLPFDKIFKICIVLMLFFVLLGMGLTLTVKDFVAVFTKPMSIVAGLFLQYGLLPLAAVFIGRMMGFYDAMPFVFIGIVLVMASPGGVMSNLFTQLTKGDLALSISLTAISTILSLIFTPLLLNLYCSNVPDVEIPVGLIVATIVVLVVLPLTIGMSVRAKWPDFAQKSKKVFTVLGLVALLFLVCAGVISNLETFKEIQRYGMAALAAFLLACSALILGIIGSKLSGSGNSRNRAMTYQCLIRNTSLSMAIALLMQDVMGDFYSSMFVTAALYSICMFIVAGISIAVYKKLPVD